MGPIGSAPSVSGTGRRLARAAALLSAITVLARLAGFGRTAAFTRSVGTGCVGSVYQTANTVPNIVFDIVAGGMLSALVVPFVAPTLRTADTERTNALVSALLSWAVVILVPVAAVIALAAHPIVGLLLGPDHCAGAQSLGTRMLVVFAPQVVFYGLGVVLGGVLTAGEHFVWPALAPLLSSLVVVGVYIGYGAMAGAGRNPVGLPRDAELLLSIGTTAGVIVLALCLLPPVWRTGVRFRPTLRFPTGIAGAVRTAAVAGAATLAAQELSTAVMIRLANSHTSDGTLVIVTTAQTVYLLPWAVLSLPIATTAFPRLASTWQSGDHAEFTRRVRSSTSLVVAAAAGGTAVLVAVSEPAGAVLFRTGASSVAAFAPSVIGFALGLVGWSLVALLARSLYAAGQVVAAALAQVVGQGSIIVLDIALSVAAGPAHRGLVLGIGNSVGVTLAAALLVVLGRRSGAVVLTRETGRGVLAAALAAGLGGGLGWLVGAHLPGRGAIAGLADSLVAVFVAAVVFAAVLALMDKPLVSQLRRQLPARLRS
jgi:putative peptidoglycan lipid II flippase